MGLGSLRWDFRRTCANGRAHFATAWDGGCHLTRRDDEVVGLLDASMSRSGFGVRSQLGAETMLGSSRRTSAANPSSERDNSHKTWFAQGSGHHERLTGFK